MDKIDAGSPYLLIIYAVIAHKRCTFTLNAIITSMSWKRILGIKYCSYCAAFSFTLAALQMHLLAAYPLANAWGVNNERSDLVSNRFLG